MLIRNHTRTGAEQFQAVVAVETILDDKKVKIAESDRPTERRRRRFNNDYSRASQQQQQQVGARAAEHTDVTAAASVSVREAIHNHDNECAQISDISITETDHDFNFIRQQSVD